MTSTGIDALDPDYQPLAARALDQLRAALADLPPHVLFVVGRDAIAASLGPALALLNHEEERAAVAAHFQQILVLLLAEIGQAQHEADGAAVAGQSRPRSRSRRSRTPAHLVH